MNARDLIKYFDIKYPSLERFGDKLSRVPPEVVEALKIRDFNPDAEYVANATAMAEVSVFPGIDFTAADLVPGNYLLFELPSEGERLLPGLANPDTIRLVLPEKAAVTFREIYSGRSQTPVSLKIGDEFVFKQGETELAKATLVTLGEATALKIG